MAYKIQRPYAIYAAKKVIPIEGFSDGLEGLNQSQKNDILQMVIQEYGSYGEMPTGAIIATGNLADVQTSELLRQKIGSIEKACGDYSDDRFGWVLKDIKKLHKPIFVKGQ
ncbi:MAG TPA: hypothetical protein VHP38_02225 [Ruminiclostridium sp.]|nr:hypothetical protein [Ruminiclostridium sp.]